MDSYRLRFLLAAACAGVALDAAGQPLTLQRALELTELGNPRIAAARAQLEGASAGVVTARQYPNPEFEGLTGGIRARVPGVAGGRGTSLALAQPLELPSVRDTRIRGAESGRLVGEMLLAETRLDVRAALRQAYFDVLRRKAELTLAADTQSLLEQIRSRIEVRVRVGEAAKFELTRAEAELATAATATASARLRIAQAFAQLRAVIGAPLPAELDVVSMEPGDARAASLAELREEVLARSPSLAQARAVVTRAELRVENERALRLPQPTVIVGTDRQPETSQLIFGLAVPLPIFNQRQGQIGEALAALEQAKASVEARRLELIGALEVAVQRLEIARQQVEAFEGGLLKQAESALSVAESAFRFGERGFIEVLDAQRVLRQVRSDFLAARFEQQAALIEIDRLRALDLTEVKQ
jgi:cobalt-zinc-cadmium efflux system outer membrane protein